MKFSAALARHLTWLNLPGALLLALLQRTPVVRVAATAGEFVLASPIGHVLRSAVAATATLGTLHSLAGATQFVQSPTGTIRGTVGTTLSVGFTITGSPLPPNFFTLESPLPPGLRTIPEVQGNRISSGSPVITGIPTEAGSFSVSVTGSDGAFSQTDTINFIITGGTVTAPAITTQPATQTVTAGATVTFTVTASGSPTFQWRKDGATLTGATAATLTRTNVTAADAGAYSVVVTNSAGSATSNVATLTVNATTAAPAITTPPANQTGAIGGSATFTVVATGNPAPTYQWLKNSIAIAGATSASLTLSNLSLADATNYVVNVSNSSGTVTSAAATLNVNAVSSAPVISAQPTSQTVPPGSTVALTVTANGVPTPAYQWRRNGTPLAGATSPTLVLTGATTLAGTYTVAVANSLGTVISAAANLTLATGGEFGRLINLSILTSVSATDAVFTLGTVLGGAGTSGNKSVLVRAVGPSLGALGVPGTLDDPKMDMFAGTSVIAANNDWNGTAALSNAFAQVGAFAFATAASKDAAIFNPSTPARDYTVQVSSNVSGGAGAVIAEIYDATPTAAFTATTPRLINVSVRKQIDAGTTLTAGFVVGPIGGTVARTVLVRAIGPGLAAFGVPGTMPDPKLELFSGTSVIAANDNWGGDAQLTAAGSAVGAFSIADPASKDAMILITLAPGNYTAQVSGVAAGGVALVEVYEVP